MKAKTKKTDKKDAPQEARETPVGFFTRGDVKDALEAEAKKVSRSRSRHLHVILAERFGLGITDITRHHMAAIHHHPRTPHDRDRTISRISIRELPLLLTAMKEAGYVSVH